MGGASRGLVESWIIEALISFVASMRREPKNCRALDHNGS